MPLPRDKNETVLRARALRRNLSLPEGLLWIELRKRPSGFKFRRQHPIGPYIADFYCAAAKLIVEIDGQSHSMGDRVRYDLRRDRWLSESGLKVLRFDAQDAMRDLGSVLTAIVAECRRQ